MQEKNYLSVTLFVLIVFVLLLSGNYLIKNKNKISPVKIKDIRIDNSKDYIYFTDSDIASEELDLTYSTIHINMNSTDAKNKEDELNQEMNIAKGSIRKYSKEEVEKKEFTKTVQEGEIYYAEYLKYDVLVSDNYVTLETIKGHYNLSSSDDNNTIKYYTFSKEDGHIMSMDEIKNANKIKNSDIEKTKEKYIEDNEDITIKEYELYIDKYGNTIMNLLVNSGDITYNDTVKIN